MLNKTTINLEMYPQLIGHITINQDYLIVSQNGRDYAFQISGQSREKLQKLLSMMDGKHSLMQLQETFFSQNPEIIHELIINLDKQGFIDDASDLKNNLSSDASLELHNFASQLIDKSMNNNSLWQALNDHKHNLPENLIYGFVIEHYHFFAQNSYFYSPLFNFQGSAKIRKSLQERYSQEYGQDELLLTALKTINISHQALSETLPLPETTAICNALTYWANFDPVFLLSIMGVLANQRLKTFELYIQTCEQMQIASIFIQPLQELINYKLNCNSESFINSIFSEIAPMNEATKQRLKSQIYLFVEIYDNFYQAIWNHYTNNSNLLRKLALI